MASLLIQSVFWACGFLVIYSYVLYPLILLGLQRFWAPEAPAFSAQTPPVSIIIAAYNEAKVIEARVQNCLALDYPKDKLEIIIASDGSDDGTAEIARKFESQGVILFDFKQRRGKVNVLNDVVPQAKHSILVFSDANTHFEKNAIHELVGYFQDPAVGCVMGRVQFVNAQGSKTADLEGVYWRIETFLKRVEGARGGLVAANGAIFALRKALYRRCPPGTLTEDQVICMRVLEDGHKVMYAPKAVAIEEAAKYISHERKRRIRIGAGNFQSLGMLRSMLDLRRGFPSFAFWSHKVLRWLAPFFLILVFAANALLLGRHFYRQVFFLQVSFYGAAVIGRILNRASVHIKSFSLCYYFVSMNFALLLGFFRFISGKQKVAWERTER